MFIARRTEICTDFPDLSAFLDGPPKRDSLPAGGNALQSLPVFHQLGSDSRISRDVVFFVGRDATFLVQKA